MGELTEERWAVISERGCEARDLKHADAVSLVRRLVSERVRGLCVVTSEAAARLSAKPAEVSPNGAKPPAAETAAPRKRAARKKQTAAT